MPVYVYWDMISGMTGFEETKKSQASILCKSCGLCCTGHLFIWAKLRPAELDAAEALGMTVFRSDPGQRGFSQPCPLWQGECTIHSSPHYPHVCRAYQCKLLKEMLRKNTSLTEALSVVEQAKGMIHELEALLPESPHINFRERLAAQLEAAEGLSGSGGPEETDPELQLKAETLLTFYEQVFGVTDLIEKPEGE